MVGKILRQGGVQLNYLLCKKPPPFFEPTFLINLLSFEPALI